MIGILGIFFALITTAALGQDRSANLTIATFNVSNLAGPETVVYTRKLYDRPQYEAKLSWIASALLRVDADIIALQEVWGRDVAEDLLSLLGATATHEMLMSERGGPQSVLLVRAPWKIQSHTILDSFPDDYFMSNAQQRSDTLEPTIAVSLTDFTNPVISAIVQHSDRPDIPAVNVFAVKMKSLAPTRLRDLAELEQGLVLAVSAGLSVIHRNAEAVALRFLVQKLLNESGTPVVVLGDFSESTDSQTLQLLTHGGIATSQVSALLRERRPASDNDTLFSSVKFEELRSDLSFAYSFIFRGEKSLLDDILVSEEFVPTNPDPDWRFDRLDILTDHLSESSTREKRRVRSDHAILVAHFRHVRR